MGQNNKNNNRTNDAVIDYDDDNDDERLITYPRDIYNCRMKWSVCKKENGKKMTQVEEKKRKNGLIAIAGWTRLRRSTTLTDDYVSVAAAVAAGDARLFLSEKTSTDVSQFVKFVYMIYLFQMAPFRRRLLLSFYSMH